MSNDIKVTPEQIQQFAMQFTSEEWDTLFTHRRAADFFAPLKAGNFAAAQAIARRLLQPDPDAGLPANTPPAARALLQSAADLQSFLASRPDVREFLAELTPEMRQMFIDSLRERIADQNALVARYMPAPGREFDDPADEELAADREAKLDVERAAENQQRQN